MNAWAALGYKKSLLLLGIMFDAYDGTNNPLGTYANVIDALNPSASQDTASLTTFNGQPVNGGVVYWNSIEDVKAKTDWVKANGYCGIFCFCVNYDKLNDSRSLLQNIYNETNP
jgi:hypothetical protein